MSPLVEPVRDELVLAGQLRLHVVQWGVAGPPVVCLHGLTANAFCFQAFADVLATDYRVIAYDLRGRGRSERPEQGYSVPIHAADLDHLLTALGLERPALLGHSLGALIALFYAAWRPERISKLILVDAGAPLPWSRPEEQPAWLSASIARLGTPVASFEAYRQRLQGLPFLGPWWNAYLDRYLEHDVERLPDGSVRSRVYREGVLEEGRRANEARPAEQWKRVQAPTLILRAGAGMLAPDDQLLSEEAVREMVAQIPRAQLREFPMLNHYTILFGVTPEPAQAIRAFLAEGEEVPAEAQS
ncbi:MAG: alpha/beta hydrolase [Thermogemmatispora sp.]|uniref:alpha/beta fold hydrolase n=1 Tax=Thermogemmatispora sp. TaxID=1968838 RepID=UPI001D6EFA93|nr:alpha/beta hydrolase [Thermogemmatispora sp.]MBX5451770.1 alpha/beta hydrolase [Thermogemmatispora sp.]